ncbi:MAG: TldD/PmbA family protein [Candidatus Hodarchaeota archaeon]
MELSDLRYFASLAMDVGEKQKPDEFEVYLQYSDVAMIQIENGRLGQISRTIDNGMGFRIAYSKQTGMGFTSELEEEVITQTIQNTAMTAQKSRDNEEWLGLPKKSGQPTNKAFSNQKLLDTPLEDLIEISSDMLTSCNVNGVQDPITPIFGGVSLMGIKSIIMNSHGIDATDEISLFLCFLGVLSVREGKPGPLHLDYRISREEILDDANTFSTEVAKEAYELADAKKIKVPRSVPVVLAPGALSSIGSFVFLPSVRADKKQQGNSFLADRLGEEFLPRELEMYDDGTRLEGIYSSNFDAEGIAKQKTVLFQDGVFQNFLYDSTSATKDNTLSTGNAQREDTSGVNPGDYANIPSVGVNNWVVKPGNTDLDSLIEDIKYGILINSIQGAHQGVPETGEFTGVINPGYIIKNGEITDPVLGLGVAGNILNLFGNFEGATRTVKPGLGSLLAEYDSLLPHTRFKEMRIVS